MNAENKITIKSVNLDDARLPSVIHGAIGNPTQFGGGYFKECQPPPFFRERKA
jgi:hypothetical protein